jgi:hypothetical protein
MTLVEKNFGRQVLWRAAESESPVFYFLGEPEIGELDVTVSSDQDVLGLEIAVDDVPLVQVFEDKDNLGGIEPK